MNEQTHAVTDVGALDSEQLRGWCLAQGTSAVLWEWPFTSSASQFYKNDIKGCNQNYNIGNDQATVWS